MSLIPLTLLLPTSARNLSRLLVLSPDKLTEHDTPMLHHIQQDETVQRFYDLAQEFRGLL